MEQTACNIMTLCSCVDFNVIMRHVLKHATCNICCSIHVTWIKFYVNTFWMGHTHTYLLAASPSTKYLIWTCDISLQCKQQHTLYCRYWHFRPSFDSLPCRLCTCRYLSVEIGNIRIWIKLFIFLPISTNSNCYKGSIDCCESLRCYKWFIVEIKLLFIST